MPSHDDIGDSCKKFSGTEQEFPEVRDKCREKRKKYLDEKLGKGERIVWEAPFRQRTYSQ